MRILCVIMIHSILYMNIEYQKGHYINSLFVLWILITFVDICSGSFCWRSDDCLRSWELGDLLPGQREIQATGRTSGADLDPSVWRQPQAEDVSAKSTITNFHVSVTFYSSFDWNICLTIYYYYYPCKQISKCFTTSTYTM